MKPLFKPASEFNCQTIVRAAVATALTFAFGFSAERAQARPLGIDVSSYQGSGINWTSVKNSGRSFAWAKATEGTSITDSDFTINENNGKGAGVIMGAYHFAHPESASAGTEENHFWAVAGGYIKADGKTLMPMLDMEVFSGHVGATSYSDWANQFNNALVADANAAGVRITPFIYTSSCNACNFNSSIAGWNADLANYNGESSQTGNPWNTCTSCEVWGSGVWDAWQYTDSASVSGVSGGVDADVINGSSVSAYTATGNGAWHTWGSLGGVFSANIASCSWGANRLDLLGIGTGGYIYHKYWNGTAWVPSTTGWDQLSYLPNVHGDIGAVSWGSGRIDFFVQGPDNHCYHGYYDSSVGWQGLEDLGGLFAPTIGFAASSWASGRLDVFGAGIGSSNLFHISYQSGSGWSAWQNLGGTVTQTPGAVSWGANRIDAFVVGTGACNHISWDGSQWSAFDSLGGSFAPYGLAASSMAYRQLDVFGIGVGAPNVVYDLTYNGSWGIWTSRGGSCTSTPSATSWGPGRIDAFVRGTDNGCWHNFFQ